MVCSEHYSFKKWFSSSYLENAMKSAMERKAVNNKIMQWKTTNRADKANLLSFKVSRSLGPDFSLRVTEFWCLRHPYSTSDPFIFSLP